MESQTHGNITYIYIYINLYVTVTVPEVAYAVNFIDLLMMDTECVRNM
jgi:hypothetical protein